MEISEEEWLKNMQFNRNLLLQYLQAQKKEKNKPINLVEVGIEIDSNQEKQKPSEES